MAFSEKRSGGGRWIVIALVTLVVLALVFWWMGAFHGAPKNTREVYQTQTTDLSGGKLVVTDANRPGVKVTVPTVKMTDVPASAAPAPGATPAAK